MTKQRIVTASENGGHPAPVRVEVSAPYGIDAAMNRVKDAGPTGANDQAGADVEPDELRARHHTVLPAYKRHYVRSLKVFVSLCPTKCAGNRTDPPGGRSSRWLRESLRERRFEMILPGPDLLDPELRAATLQVDRRDLVVEGQVLRDPPPDSGVWNPRGP